MKKTILTLLLALPLAIQAQNQYVGFAWEPSPDNADGYKLYLNGTNNIANTNSLLAYVPVSIFPLAITNSIHATAYNNVTNESVQSNSVLIYRPVAPIGLSSSNLTSNGVLIQWSPNTNDNVNAYKILVGTNANNLNVLSNILGRTNTNFYLDATNIIRSTLNYVAVLAYNNVYNATYAVLESPLSTNIGIILPPRPPILRINVIVQTSTNLISWQSLTNYEYLAEMKQGHGAFRAKLEIEKN